MENKTSDRTSNKQPGNQSYLLPLNNAEIYCERRSIGEPLVLLHGFSGAGTNWGLIFQEPPDGYELIVVDLRGHGHSTNPGGVFTHRQAAFDVYALLDKLEIDRFKAIGLSGGGNTLLHMATQQPARVEAMVIVSATPYFPDQVRVLMAQIGPENRTDVEWQQMRKWHIHGDEQIRALWMQANAFKDSYDDMNFTPPLLATITARTLIVHGDKDPCYQNRLITEMSDAIPNSNLWIVPNGGHGPVFGKLRDAFVETALDFLGGWAQSK